MARGAELLVGLDLGSSEVVVMVGESDLDGSLAVHGLGTALCEGLRKGVVVDLEATVSAIVSAIKEAELSSGCEIHSVFASVQGAHIKGFNSHGVVPVKGGEVVQADIDRVLEAARAVALPAEQDVLHVLPQEFVLDGLDLIREPLGMSGVRLEARVHMVTTAMSAAHNVVKCCERAGLHVADLILAPLASAEAVLAAEERELGVVCVDLGAGTTGVIVYDHGTVRHSAVIAVGGSHVTGDIAAGLRTPLREAERLKRRYGSALAIAVPADESIEVVGMDHGAGRQLARQILAEIIEPRIEEIFALVQRQLIRSGFDASLPAGVVLTGAGAMLPEIEALAERVFQMPVRIGVPLACGGMEEEVALPAMAAAIGLMRYGAQPADYRATTRDSTHLLGRVVGWLREWM